MDLKSQKSEKLPCINCVAKVKISYKVLLSMKAGWNQLLQRWLKLHLGLPNAPKPSTMWSWAAQVQCNINLKMKLESLPF